MIKWMPIRISRFLSRCHPLIKIIPVEWDYTMPFGILHSKTPPDKVKRLIKAIRQWADVSRRRNCKWNTLH